LYSVQKSRIRNITGKVCIPKIGKKLNDAVKKSTQASDSHYSFSKSIDDTKSVSESSVSQDSSKKKVRSHLGDPFVKAYLISSLEVQFFRSQTEKI